MSKLLQYLTDHHTDMLDDLGEFVSRESPSYDKERMDSFAEFLAGYANGLGAEVETIPIEERGNHLRIVWRDENAENPSSSSGISTRCGPPERSMRCRSGSRTASPAAPASSI
jgi:acetylornithine deacetylase/succinyl-diaminopimelate desuccinylase-like protein